MMIGIFVVKGRPSDGNDALKAINRGIYTAQIIAIIGAGLVAFLYIGNPKGSTISHPGVTTSFNPLDTSAGGIARRTDQVTP